MIFAHIENGKVKGFFKKEIHGDKIPKNSIEITNSEWQYALEINANAYENGKFIVKDFRTLGEKTADLADSERRKRDSLIDDVEWRLLRYERQEALAAVTTDTAAWYQNALVYVQALRDVPQQSGFPNNINWPVLLEQ